MAGWLSGWLPYGRGLPSQPHINQGLSERSIVGGAVRCKVSVPHSPPTDRPPSLAAARSPACSLPLLARRGQEISHTISEAARRRRRRGLFSSLALRRRLHRRRCQLVHSRIVLMGGKCCAKSLSARPVLRSFNALRNHIWFGGGKEREGTDGRGRARAV